MHRRFCGNQGTTPRTENPEYLVQRREALVLGKSRCPALKQGGIGGIPTGEGKGGRGKESSMALLALLELLELLAFWEKTLPLLVFGRSARTWILSAGNRQC
jgi:hypothetical protein